MPRRYASAITARAIYKMFDMRWRTLHVDTTAITAAIQPTLRCRQRRRYALLITISPRYDATRAIAPADTIAIFAAAYYAILLRYASAAWLFLRRFYMPLLPAPRKRQYTHVMNTIYHINVRQVLLLWRC